MSCSKSDLYLRICYCNQICHFYAALETFLPQPLHDKAKLATVVMKFLDLSMKMKAANSKDCQRLLLCQLNGQVSGQSLNNWHLGQVCSLGLAKMASGSHTASMQNMVIRVIKFSTEEYKIRYIFGKKSSYFRARTMDAKWGNRLHCTAENQIPIPNL